MPRPELNPTEEQRRLVKSMAAVGVPTRTSRAKLESVLPRPCEGIFERNWIWE
jgi:hypothetical protein